MASELVFNALSIGRGLVAAVLSCVKREDIYESRIMPADLNFYCPFLS